MGRLATKRGQRTGRLAVLACILSACSQQQDIEQPPDVEQPVVQQQPVVEPQSADEQLPPEQEAEVEVEQLAPAEQEPAVDCGKAERDATYFKTTDYIEKAEESCPNLVWVGGLETTYHSWNGRQYEVRSPYPDDVMRDGFIDVSDISRLLHHKTENQIEELLLDLFGDTTLPQDLPTLREPLVYDEHWYKAFLPPRLRATTNVDSYTSELYVPRKDLHVESTHIVYTPHAEAFSRVAILIQGHDDGYLANEAVHFLEAGYAVILRGMPGFANDRLTIGNEDYKGDHDVLYDLESDDFNPLTVFVQPNIVAVNLASHLFPGKQIVVAGISGGGHMALLLHALDQRVSRSISVSGWKPFFLRYRQELKDFQGDYEQNTNRFYQRHAIDYLDLVVLATRGTRRHYQVWVVGDTSAFGGHDYRYYASQLSEATRGNFRLILDEHSEGHQIELAHLNAYFMMDSDPPPPELDDFR